MLFPKHEIAEAIGETQVFAHDSAEALSETELPKHNFAKAMGEMQLPKHNLADAKSETDAKSERNFSKHKFQMLYMRRNF
jgi:hypothetical protein